MGLLDEPGLERLLAAGCPGCGSSRLTFDTYVDGRMPIMGGEPVGRITWVYDGEKFVDGVYDVRCADCQRPVFAADECPRCHAADGLARALKTPNGWPVPAQCPSCDEEQVGYLAFVPARVVVERGQRADKARPRAEMHDEGFHGFRVDCRDCGTVAEQTEACPLCGAVGPLRPRP